MDSNSSINSFQNFVSLLLSDNGTVSKSAAAFNIPTENNCV